MFLLVGCVIVLFSNEKPISVLEMGFYINSWL